jgi:ribosomal protein L2
MSKNYIVILFLFSAAVLLPGTAFAQANVNENLETAFLYVDGTKGSDSNPGTQALPLKTIGAASAIAASNNSASIGTRVTINPGTYRESIALGGSRTSLPITFQAATKGTVILSGSEILTGWTQSPSNQHLYSSAWNNNWGLCPTVSTCPYREDITQRQELVVVNGSVLTQVLLYSSLQPGTFYIDSADSLVYVWPASGTNMSTATVEAAVTPVLWSILGSKNVVVRGLTFQYANSCNGSGAVIVSSTSSNILFDSDTFQWNNAVGLSIGYPATYFTVENSVATHNGDSGFAVRQTNYGLWQSNIASYNNWRGAQGALYGCNTSGMHYFLAHHDTINGLVTIFNQSYGLHWDTDNADITATGVIAANNLYVGVFAEKDEGPLSMSNSYMCSQNSNLAVGGLGFRDSENFTLTNSVLYNNAGAQISLTGDAGGIAVTNWETGQVYNLLNKNFTNTGNILQGMDSTQQGFFDGTLGGTEWTDFQSTLTSSNNTWWNTSNALFFETPAPANNTLNDLSAWQGLTGQDISSTWSAPAGNLAATCTFTPETDFWLTVAAPNATTDASGTAVLNYTVTALNFNGTVTLATDGISEVSGLTGTLSVSSVKSAGTSALTLHVAAGTPPGNYPIVVLATSGNTTHTVTAQLTVPSTQMQLSTASLAFPNQQVNTTGAPQSITLTNFSKTALSITSIVASKSFGETNTCGTSVKAGATCTISVTFTPTGALTWKGTISITDGDLTSPQIVSLSGTGTPAPAVTISPASLTFPNEAVGMSSPLQVATLTNTGTVQLTITSIALAGNNPGDYIETTTCSGALAAGSSCNFTVTFRPTTTGSRKASVTITDNTSNGSQTLSLSGAGSNAAVSFSPSSVTFTSQGVGIKSAAQQVILTNTSSVQLNITSIALTGSVPGDYAQTNNCGSSVAASGTCTFSITFTPSSTGLRQASVTITGNTSKGSQNLNLSGTGSDPTVTLSPSSLTFTSQGIGTKSTAQTVTFTNTSSIKLNISSIALTGSNPGDYAQTNTCGSSVAGGGTCTFSVTFTPTTTGIRKANVTITDNTYSGSQNLSLTGTGSYAAANLVPSSLTFAKQTVGTSSTSKIVTLTNSSNVPLTISKISLTGANPGDYSQTNTCGSGVASKATCTFTVTFTPTASGTRSASITITDNTSTGSNAITMTGTGL